MNNNVPTTNNNRLGCRNGARIFLVLCLSNTMERREKTMNLYKQFDLDPPDPTEPEVICKDYKQDDLYFGDECFATGDGYVLAEDVYEYMEQRFGKVVTIE